MPFIQSAFTEHVICANIVVNHPASQAEGDCPWEGIISPCDPGTERKQPRPTEDGEGVVVRKALTE